MILSLKEDLLERIKNINWCYNCGKEIKVNIKFKIKYAGSWKEAKTFYKDLNWENTGLEAKNDIISIISVKYNDELLKWNELFPSVKKFISENVIGKIENIKNENNLDDKFVGCIRWDVIHIIKENIYNELSPLPGFYLNLLEIYESGNFPCGWIGTYPEGFLVVY